MKLIVLITTFLMLLDATCRHKQAAVTVTLGDDSVKKAAVDTIPKHADKEFGKTEGKVSHQFAANGCATVIVSLTETGELILIPRTPLETKFDKDGLEIYFNYHPLKMRQPPGCEKGIPADITDISFK